MTPRVVAFVAQGCHLCDSALDVVVEVCEEHGLSFEIVDITDDPTLEAGYRSAIPVVEIDGERAFTYHVPPGALRDRIRAPR